jgi:Outer membrane protein beta-barrel family
MNAQFALGEGHDLRIRTNITVGASYLTSFSERETDTSTGDLLNTAETSYLVDGDNWGGNGQLTWRKRLSDGGRSVVAELRSAVSDDELAGELNSLTAQDGRDPRSMQEIIQDQGRDGRQWSQTVRIALTQPLGAGKLLEIFGQHSAVNEDQDNSVFDLGSGSPVFNADLSSGFERTYTYLRGGARFNRNTEKSRFVLGFQVQNSNLDGAILNRDQTITNGYTHFLPNLDFRLRVTDAQNLSLRYNTSTREPSLTELQPFADNINPLNIYVGNPDLQPQYTHRMNGDYRFFDQFSFLNVFAFGGFNYTQDAIAQSRIFDDLGRQRRTPVNTDGAWSTNGGITFGTPIRRLGIEIGLQYRASYAESTEFINAEKNRSQILQNSILASVENRIKDKFDIRASARFAFNDVNYSLNDELDQSYVNSTYTGDATYYMSEAWTIGSTFNYRIFGDRQITSGENIARWDAYISRFIMNNRGSIELRMYDLLNQSQGVNISSSANFIQETRTESLGQYILLRVNMRVGRVGRGRGRAGRGGQQRRGR